MLYRKIVLLAGRYDTTPLVYNYLHEHFRVEKIIIEEPVPRKEFLKKRIKKLGWLTVFGQIAFQLTISKLLRKTSRKRIDEIIAEYKLSREPVPGEEIIPVASANSTECLQALQTLQPDVVIVHGTRIISKKILKEVPALFINIHAGITPRYRGSHGAYWALANNDKENCGITVHLVDAGIDTGNILFQEKISLKKNDNFATYPYLQLARGLQLIKKSIELLREGIQPVVKNDLNSALWHHPTIWGYLYKRITKGVK
jgi:folate-dependent phosphoribosylglycinamide formyltransferase PurN